MKAVLWEVSAQVSPRLGLVRVSVGGQPPYRMQRQRQHYRNSPPHLLLCHMVIQDEEQQREDRAGSPIGSMSPTGCLGA